MTLEIYENGRKIIREGRVSWFGRTTQEELGTLVSQYDGEAVDKFLWSEEYEKLKPLEQQLIQVFHPGVDQRVTSKTYMPNRLLVGIRKWCLKRENLRLTCPRCGGTGHYSYNQIDGTRCFKCSGWKYILPRLSKKWLVLVADEWNNRHNAE